MRTPYRARTFVFLVLVAGITAVGAVDLSGVVLNRDSTAKAGVVVELAGAGLSATTDAAGRWSIDGTSGVAARWTNSVNPASGHIEIDGLRMRPVLGRSDAKGRVWSRQGEAGAVVAAPRAMETAGVDTLLYSWNGKIFLRDTLSAPTRQNMVRKYDTAFNPAITYGYLTDSRDGNVYRTVTVNGRLWMAENVNFNVSSGSACHNRASSCWDSYGRLYEWSKAKIVCPSGWHLPDTTEWRSLKQSYSTGYMLKSASDWKTDAGSRAGGSNRVGFTAMPGGGYSTSTGYYGFETYAAWWTKTPFSSISSIYMYLNHLSELNLYMTDVLDKHSVRCIKDTL